jgi:hypothetical protein
MVLLNTHDTDSRAISTLRQRAHLSDPWTDTGARVPALRARYVTNFWFTNLWAGPTVDSVLCRRPFRASSVAKPAYNEQGEYPSDHLPVCVIMDTGVQGAGEAHRNTSAPSR